MKFLGESYKKGERNQIYVWGNSLDDWRSLRGLTPYNSVMSVVCYVCVLLTSQTYFLALTALDTIKITLGPPVTSPSSQMVLSSVTGCTSVKY